MKKIFSLLKTGQGYFLIVQRSTRSLSFMLCKRWLSYNTTVSRSRGSMDSTAVITACVDRDGASLPMSCAEALRLLAFSCRLMEPLSPFGLLSSCYPQRPFGTVVIPHSFTLHPDCKLFPVPYLLAVGWRTPKYVTSDSWVLERWLGG